MRSSSMIRKYLLAFGVALGMSASVWANCPSGMTQTGADEANACQITTATQLQSINTARSLHYKLMNDIDLNGVTWTPIGDSADKFTGSFDGQGFAVSNLKVSNSGSRFQGLFGYLEGATVKNLSIINADITGLATSAILAGGAYVGSAIENINVSGKVSVTDNSQNTTKKRGQVIPITYSLVTNVLVGNTHSNTITHTNL